MPRKAKGARLYLRHARNGRAAQFVILDTGGIERGTGTADRRQAEAALAAYIGARDGRPGGPVGPEAITVDQVLDIYGTEHAPHVADPARIGFAIDALLDWWGGKPVSSITKATCGRYVRERRRKDGQPAAIGTSRKELGTLQAALSYCRGEGYLVGGPNVTLPDRPEPKDRWLTRDEAARLLRAARRRPETRHLCRFILVGLYTGTRRDATLALRFDPHPGGGHFDLEAGVLFRRAAGAGQTKKRRNPARLPRRLAAHARRWARSGGWVVEWRGNRVGSIKTAWRRICADAGLEGVTPHTLRHTSITWAMQAGVPLGDAAQFYSVTVDVLERVYWHHHPEFQKGTADALDRRKA